MIQRSESLLSEIRELEQLLDGIPATAVIQRLSFENRLKSVRQALERELTTPRPSRSREGHALP